MDFKCQITDLLSRVDLTRSMLSSTVRDFKKVRPEDAYRPLRTLADSICNDLRTILKTQRRHVLSCMLQRSVREIGSSEAKVLLEKDLAPYLSEKGRSATTRARVTEVKDDPSKTLKAYERLI